MKQLKQLYGKLMSFPPIIMWIGIFVAGGIAGFLATSALHSWRNSVPDYGAWATLLLTVATVVVIGYQGRQLKKQLELQALTSLYSEWNSTEMKQARCELSKSLELKIYNTDLDKVEQVFELLERISSYYRQEVLSKELIWATIGWYLMRYYYYVREAGAIDGVQEKWSGDKTLYEDLANLYNDLITLEIESRRNKGERINGVTRIEEMFKAELDKFKETEGK